MQAPLGSSSASVAEGTPVAVAAVPQGCPVCGGPGLEIPQYRSVGLSRCAGCGLVFQLADVVSVEDEYASGEYEAVHDAYFGGARVFRHIAGRRTRWLRRRLASGSLLELGPGPGFFLDATRRAGFNPVGVEPSPELAARAAAESGVRVECGFLNEVELPRRRFDAVCMFHVFEHVENPPELLDQVSDRLNDRGLLVMEVPNLASAMAQRRGDRWGVVQPCNLHISHFTPSSLCEVVGRAGFEVLAIDTISPWDYIPPADRWRLRALLGYTYRAAKLRTLRLTHPSGFDHLRLVARWPR